MKPPTYQPLHRCRRCRSDFVHPTAWRERSGARWEVDLRCGECGHRRTTAADDREAIAFDARLDDQLEAMRTRAESLERERMAAETDAFAYALAHDLIDPGDFAR